MTRLPESRPPTHPGEMLLQEFLKPLNIPQTVFAERIGVSYVRLNSIVKGHRGVTPDTALRLERATGMSAGFWLNLQRDLGSLADAPLSGGEGDQEDPAAGRARQYVRAHA